MKHVEYLDGFQYTGGVLNFFPHAEGYVNVTSGTTGKRIYNYVYNYTDHLGNIRLSYTKDAVSNQLKIMEENHYYPFGLKHQKYTPGGSLGLKAIDEETARPSSMTSTPYNYKYNGQEWQDELGLNMYDMDMRQYDPAIARWVVLDPVIHHSMSPYNAFDNNPVFWADPSGADSIFDSLGTEVASVTNLSTGTTIGAGGKGDNKTDKTSALAKAAAGASSTSSGSAIGGISASWTPGDEAQFDGSDAIPGAQGLPAVIANSKQSLNAGLESRAIMANQRWYHYNFGASISSWDGVRRAPMTWSSPNSYFFGDPGRRIAMGMLQGGAAELTGYGMGQALKPVSKVVTSSDGFLFGGINTTAPFNIPAQRFGNMNAVGAADYWGLRIGSDEVLNRSLNAIKTEWNPLTQYTTGIIPRGTPIKVGIVGPQGGFYGGIYSGGGVQFRVNSGSVINQSTNIP